MGKDGAERLFNVYFFQLCNPFLLKD
jgi:hypothetical protein